MREASVVGGRVQTKVELKLGCEKGDDMSENKSLAQMNREDFLEILDGYFVPPEKRSRLTHEEIRILAVRFNERINVPIVSETFEEAILFKVILKMDVFLYDHLPNELYDMIRSSEKGISEAESELLLGRLVKVANRKIDIPYLPELVEAFLIRFVLGIVMKALCQNWSLERAIEASDEVVEGGDEEKSFGRRKLGRN